MVNKNYLRGHLGEKRLQALLEKEGYAIQRAHASKGVFDILAVHPEDGIKFIQVKRSKTPIKKTQSIINQNRDDIDKMLEFHTDNYEGVSRELWMWFDPIAGSRSGTWRVLTITDNKIAEVE